MLLLKAQLRQRVVQRGAIVGAVCDDLFACGSGLVGGCASGRTLWLKAFSCKPCQWLFVCVCMCVCMCVFRLDHKVLLRQTML